MQNYNPLSRIYGRRTGRQKGDDNWHMKLFHGFSFSHAVSTTSSASDIEQRSPHKGVSHSSSCTSWSMPARSGGTRSTNIVLNSCRHAWYCLGTRASKGCSFQSFDSMALLLSYIAALMIISFPSLAVRKNENPLSIKTSTWKSGGDHVWVGISLSLHDKLGLEDPVWLSVPWQNNRDNV